MKGKRKPSPKAPVIEDLSPRAIIAEMRAKCARGESLDPVEGLRLIELASSQLPTMPALEVRRSDGELRKKPVMNKPLLRASAAVMHTYEEAAAVQGAASGIYITRSQFERLLKQRDPETGLLYRDIWDQGLDLAKSSLKRTAWEHSKQIGSSAGVRATMWLMSNLLGWSEKRTTEQSGVVRHTHEQIPADLTKLSDTQLHDLALSQTGAGRKVTHH